MDNDFTPVIGKDVIESLTLGMYEDSRFIFREYIQNSADQIDKAIRENLISKNQAEIHINIDQVKKRVLIEDNATGIPQASVRPILQNIALSTKQRGVDKGFRGIGRLGGLAYCNQLIFETSFAGEDTKTRLTWNAKDLRDIINNRKEKEDAVSVINKITTIEVEPEERSKHYFKVILEGVTNEDLLDKSKVEEYLSMVAPLPYSTKFIFKSKIYEELKKENISLDEYNIYLNTEQLFKGYSTYIYDREGSTKRKIDEVIDIVFFKEYDDTNTLLYWGWHSVSMLNRQLRSINSSRGFRLRKSNIQIGNEYTLLKLHRDNRFNIYFFGEVHGIHDDLLPNSRRDYFVENDVNYQFEDKLRSFFHTQIHKLCYTASEINSSLKKIDDLKTFEEEFKVKQKSGFTDKEELDEYREKFDRKKDEAIKAKTKMVKIEAEANENKVGPVSKILNRVAQPVSDFNIETVEMPNHTKPKFRTDNLTSLNREERKFLKKILIIIRQVLDTNTAEDLIQKIEEELK